ncbi:hypothetical protein H5410_039860 [Solanum commersonii]|uniref:Uncharacterized protein n=1 Tax=Solanum commersonii TaxID=4109 RepID=A0A9J5XNE6_SOLCO|nr:hypothetical protein H5410_039860 [Solanum commersonii]
MAMVSPNVPMCQALKEKIEPMQKGDEPDQRADSRVDWRSQLTVPSVLETLLLSFEDLKISTSKQLKIVANTILTSYFLFARERGFKTKTTKLIVGGYWVVVNSARESES